MAQATGAQSKLLLGYQADFDTAATDGFVIGITSSGLKASRAQHTDPILRGNLNPAEPFDGLMSVSGPITVPVDSIQFWYLLKAALGSPTTAGSDPYTHTFKAGTTRPFLTLEHQFTDLGTAKYFKYTGCKVNEMSLSVGGSGAMTATFSIVGANRSIESSSFDASPTTPSFSRLKHTDLSLTEGGSALGNGNTADLTIRFNCDTSDNQYVAGDSGIIGNIPDGVMDVTGNLRCLFDSTSLLEKAIAATESSLVITLNAGTSSQLVITLPEVKYTQNDPAIEGPQGLAVSLPFAAYYQNASEATSVQMVLTNGEAHA